MRLLTLEIPWTGDPKPLHHHRVSAQSFIVVEKLHIVFYACLLVRFAYFRKRNEVGVTVSCRFRTCDESQAVLRFAYEFVIIVV